MTAPSKSQQVYKAWRFLTQLEAWVTREYNARSKQATGPMCRSSMKTKRELLSIIEQRDLEEGGLVQVIRKMFEDAGDTGLIFGKIAIRLFLELPPAVARRRGDRVM